MNVNTLLRTLPACGPRGASMGRKGHVNFEEGDSRKIIIQQMANEDGYDTGGAYWGTHRYPVWMAVTLENDGFRLFARGRDAEEIQSLVLREVPDAVFVNSVIDPIDRELFVDAMLEAAIATTEIEDEDGENIAGYNSMDFCEEAWAYARAIAEKFLAQASDLLRQGHVFSPKFTLDEMAGNDFWLTNQHHGAGFWDGDWEEATGDALTELSQKFKLPESIMLDAEMEKLFFAN